MDLVLQALEQLFIIDLSPLLPQIGLLSIELSVLDLQFLEVEIEGHYIVTGHNRIVDGRTPDLASPLEVTLSFHQELNRSDVSLVNRPHHRGQGLIPCGIDISSQLQQKF